MAKRTRSRRLVRAGITLLVVGAVMSMIESLTLTSWATQALARVTGQSAESVSGEVRKLAMEATGHRHTITLPRWLGWVMMVGGIFLIANGRGWTRRILRRRRRGRSAGRDGGEVTKIS